MDRVLLVGITSYEDKPLRGAVNDTLDFAECLVSKHNFDENCIRFVHNDRATYKKIIQELEILVSDSGPRDRIVFYFSGHGCMAPSDFKLEGKSIVEESLCPIDYDLQYSQNLLKACKLDFLFSNIHEHSKAYWIIDSCYSGVKHPFLSKEYVSDIVDYCRKAVYRPTAKFMGYPKNLASLVKKILNCPSERSLKFSSLVKSSLNTVFLSSCSSQQVSWDADWEDKPNGVFTRFLCKELQKDMSKKISTGHLLNNVKKSIHEAGYKQTPQLEGTLLTCNSSLFL